jgi:hypothetical protein
VENTLRLESPHGFPFSHPHRFAWHVPQYRKALKASFLPKSYDYDTGKLIGHVGPRGRFVPLAAGPPAVAVEAAAPKKSNVVILNDVAEAGS